MSKTVCRIIFGSHLYGTNTPTSDTDFKSVHIPSADEILLQRVKSSTGHKVIRPEGVKNTPEAVDDESYSLQRYLSLLAEGQTVTIDMLFAPSPLITSDLWDYIRSNKEKLLTKKSAAFVGYCRQQANKYGIKGSRVSAAKNAVEFFADMVEKHGTTAKVGDVLNAVGYPDYGDHTTLETKETTPGRTEDYFVCCNRMVGFKNTVKEAAAIYGRIYEEYGKRARLAETNEGIDWKALSHAVRVGREALELFTTSNITFPLPYADHILKIKRGELPYESVAEEIESLLVSVERESLTSPLRESADLGFIDDLVKEVHKNEVLGDR